MDTAIYYYAKFLVVLTAVNVLILAVYFWLYMMMGLLSKLNSNGQYNISNILTFPLVTAILLLEWNFSDNVISVIFSYFSVMRDRRLLFEIKFRRVALRSRHDMCSCRSQSYISIILRVRLIARMDVSICALVRSYKFPELVDSSA